jgi:hypothetical protein
MDDRLLFEQQARTLVIQAAVFRCLRDRGLEPQLSDTLRRSVTPAMSFAEQMTRITLATDVVAELRDDQGLLLSHDERNWVAVVVDAACERFERRQRRQQQSVVRRPSPAAAAVRVAIPLQVAATAVATVVAFRRRGGSHG